MIHDFRIRTGTAILSAALVLLWAGAQAEDWPVFHGDMLHTGYSTEYVSLALEQAWSVTSDEPQHGSPVVSGDKVIIGTTSGYIVALDADDGHRLWHFGTSNSAEAAVACDGNSVFAVSWDRNIYALNAGNGAPLWSRSVGRWLEAPPAFSDTKVFVGTEDYYLNCYDKSTGQLQWGFFAGADVFSSPAYYEGKVFFGCDNDSGYCLTEDGSLLWSTFIGGMGFASPVVSDGVVIFASVANGTGYCYNRIGAYDVNSGTRLWQYQLGENDFLFATPAIMDGVLYFATFYGQCGALDLSNGSLLWFDEGDTYPYFSSPVAADGIVYMPAFDGTVRVFDAAAGDLVTSYPVGGFIYSSAALANGRLFFGCSDSTLYAVNVTTPLNVVVTEHEQVTNPGGTLEFTVKLINSSWSSRFTDVWVDVFDSDGGSRNVGIQHGVEVPAQSDLEVPVTLNVPPNAPPGRYALSVRIGDWGETPTDLYGFRFAIAGGAGTGGWDWALVMPPESPMARD